MKLAHWRGEEKLSQADVGQRLGVHPFTVSTWERGLKVPGPATIVEIYRLTHGQVQPNDFYDLPDLTPVEADPSQPSLFDQAA